MGTVISLAQRRHGRARTRTIPRRATFYFDLADPGTYLAAERVERLPAAVVWQPARLPSPVPLAPVAATRRARELGLPVVWPEQHRTEQPLAMRVAAVASIMGRGAEFALAATRLTYCGGFDLEDPTVFAEAIAATGLELEVALWAAGSEVLDREIEAAGRFLDGHGVAGTPVVQVGRTLFEGEARLAEAAMALREEGVVRTPAFS